MLTSNILLKLSILSLAAADCHWRFDSCWWGDSITFPCGPYFTCQTLQYSLAKGVADDGIVECDFLAGFKGSIASGCGKNVCGIFGVTGKCCESPDKNIAGQITYTGHLVKREIKSSGPGTASLPPHQTCVHNKKRMSVDGQNCTKTNLWDNGGTFNVDVGEGKVIKVEHDNKLPPNREQVRLALVEGGLAGGVVDSTMERLEGRMQEFEKERTALIAQRKAVNN